MGMVGEVPDILLVRRTARQGRRVPLCFQEPSLFLLFLSLYFLPLLSPLILSLFFPFSSARAHTHPSPSLIDHKFIAKLGEDRS